MDAIKKFFEKKKASAKFKQFGQGHLLTEPQPQLRKSSSKHSAGSHLRTAPSHGAQRAAAAAVARAESHSKKSEIDWSLQAIKAQARRELEAEKKLAELQLEPENVPELKEVHLDAAPVLATSGVYFHCPLIGPEVAPYDVIKSRIKDFLFEQLGEDRVVASSLIIQTCNKNKEKVKICIETLCKYIENIVSYPSEKKYHKIRMTNRAYMERVEPILGTSEFLQSAGFVLEELPFNEEIHKFWVWSEDSSMSTLEQMRDTLISAEPLKPQLDRGLRVLLPAQATKEVALPPDFYALTVEELKKEMQLRAEAVERSQLLRTKAMRDRDELREMRKYRFSLLRIRFPDGFILQGTFGVYEKFSNVLEFVRENLVINTRPFILRLGGGGMISEEEQSLIDLRIVPAVILHFEWDLSLQEHSYDDFAFLKPEILMLVEEAMA